MDTSRTHSPATASNARRARAVDALRGFALLGVVVVNAPFFALPPDGWLPLATTLDAVVASGTTALAAGKFFLIFSFLFGFGISVALARAARSNGSTAPVRRRSIALFVIGAAHATLLFYGDILMLYALVGGAMVAMRDVSLRRLAQIAVASYAVGVLAQASIVAASTVHATTLPPLVPVDGVGYLGSFADAALARIADLPSAIVFLLAFNGPAAFSMALLGRVAAESGRFPPDPETLARLARRAPAALVVGFAASAVAAGVIVAGMVAPERVGAPAVGLAALGLSLAAPVLSAGLAVVVLAGAARAPNALLVRAFAVVGANSLSGYLAHSVLLGAVFLGWGLGFWGSLDAAAILAISLGVYVTIAIALALWTRAFGSGPAEIVLRAALRRRDGADRESGRGAR